MNNDESFHFRFPSGLRELREEEERRKLWTTDRRVNKLQQCCCLLLLQSGPDGELCWVIRARLQVAAACEEERLLTTSAAILIIDWRRHSDSLSDTNTHTVCAVLLQIIQSQIPRAHRGGVCVCVCIWVLIINITMQQHFVHYSFYLLYFLIIFWLNVDGVSEDVLKHLVFIHNPKIFPLLLSQRRKENGKYLPVNVFTNHRYVQGRYFGWCRCYYCQSADHRWNHTPGSFKGHLGTFPGFFVETKTGSFSQEVGPSTSVITETAKHDVCYNPNKVFFVPETKQSINTALSQERNRKLKKRSDSSVVLQTWP